jgi:hypothetical protein
MRIGTLWRAVTIALGLAGLGSGGTAVFITHLEAGPVALIAAGLLLVLIGIGGQLPSRLKVGDNEAAWEAVENFVERVTTDVPAGNSPEVLSALDDLAEVAPQIAAPALTSLAYKAMVQALLRRILDKLNHQFAGFDKSISGIGYYMIGEDPGTDGVIGATDTLLNGEVYVDIKSQLRSNLAAAELERVTYYSASTERAILNRIAVMFITREPLPADVEQAITDLEIPAVHVVVRGSADTVALEGALSRIFMLINAAYPARGQGDPDGATA